MSGAVVKALEWRVFCARSGNCEAKAPYGEYVIQSETDGWCLYLPWQQSEVDSVHSTLDYAKAAAQSDFDARIRSALVVSTPPADPVAAQAGWQLVPKDDDRREFSDSALPAAMISAGADVLEKASDDLRNYVAGETIDWDYGMEAVAVYRAMLSASPSPVDSRDGLIERLVGAAEKTLDNRATMLSTAGDGRPYVTITFDTLAEMHRFTAGMAELRAALAAKEQQP
ncbi:hypothetical protein ABIA16_003843 [Sinorhizobium fredii]